MRDDRAIRAVQLNDEQVATGDGKGAAFRDGEPKVQGAADGVRDFHAFGDLDRFAPEAVTHRAAGFIADLKTETHRLWTGKKLNGHVLLPVWWLGKTHTDLGDQR